MIRLGVLVIALLTFTWHAWQDFYQPTYIVLNHPHFDEQGFAHWLTKVQPKRKDVETWFRSQPWTQALKLYFPDSSTMIVDVVERKPVAQWRYGGMVDATGELFFPLPKHYDGSLPTINVVARELKTGVQFVNGLGPMLNQENVKKITVFKLKTGDWAVDMAAKQYLLFGTMDLSQRLQVAKHVLKRLHDHHQAWGRIDFRYKNGFAISKNPWVESFH